MPLPPLYKFLDVKGASLTLGNCTFKHARPSDFNDTEDLTVRSFFPEPLETALKRVEEGFTGVIIEHLHERLTCDEPQRSKLAQIQSVYRNDPQWADVVRAEIASGKYPPVYNIDYMRELIDGFVKEINEHLQDFRVLCVTSSIDSEAMWSAYAEEHRGIAIRIEPNLAKDSKFKLFRPVTYYETRPALHNDALEFLAKSLFGDQSAHRLAMTDRIIYAKTRKWEHEHEYRLAIPAFDYEAPWDTLRYHRDEITELYLGMAMNNVEWVQTVDRARAVNPSIKIFQVERNAADQLVFKRISV